MQLLRKMIALVSIFSLVPAVVAQQTAQTPANPASTSAPATAADPAKVMLKDGTEVNLKLAQALSSKTAAIGDSVELVLDQDLVVDKSLVARKGARAEAVVSNVKKAGRAGRGGELNLRLEYVKAGDTKVNLRGAQAKNGDNQTAATIGLVVAFGLLGFLKHGKQAEVQEGTPVKAYVNEDVQVASLGPAPEPAPSPTPAAASK